MNRLAVINVVGLTARLIGENTPFLNKWLNKKHLQTIKPVIPAVTCPVQSTYLTGKWPSTHGIVGNGWYFKDECEIKFWRQSNKLVQAPKIWDYARKENPQFTCSNLFWWYNMQSGADYTVTPRPNYLADGRKIPDVYTTPADLRISLQDKFGQFPLFNFWGPNTSIRSSQWIADAAVEVENKYQPTLNLIYLPHLDYNLQRHGLNFSKIGVDLNEIDKVLEGLVSFFESRDVNVVLVSEYGITDVSNPIHLNRELRKHGLLAIREEQGRELLDPGACKAFAIADHQVANIYVKDADDIELVKNIVTGIEGIGQVMTSHEIKENHLFHERTGDLVVVSDDRSWFTYYYWMDEDKAPDFAKTVDIHRKPGYDPVEMFVDPKIRFPMLKIGSKLLKKKLGFRTLLDVIPTDAKLIKGSHGRIPSSREDWPVFAGDLTNSHNATPDASIEAIDVFQQLIKLLDIKI